MTDLDTTRQSLIARIRDPRDEEAWTAFVEVYSSFVYQFVRRRGLQPADAADVTQDVMQTVFRSIDGFQHSQREGSFRKWLVAIVRTRLSDYVTRRNQQAAGSGDTRILGELLEHPAPIEEDPADEREYRQCVFRWAAERMRCKFQPSTWQAFWSTYVDGERCEDVAERLHMSIEAVYMARSRVLARLRQKIRELEL
jgi:RNA polymerase sigma-70 factor (ECF subfamily)